MPIERCCTRLTIDVQTKAHRPATQTFISLTLFNMIWRTLACKPEEKALNNRPSRKTL